MHTRIIAASAAAFLLLTSASFASAAVTATCTGTPSATSVLWSATSTGGVAPYSFLWSNGVTAASQSIAVTPGTYSLGIQATDASSTVSATSTCQAVVPFPAPSIASFTATPSTITTGGSAVLSWTVSNASSTSIDHGVGVVSSTSITVMPTATTLYTLSAINPSGTVTAQATVTVNATTTPPSGGTNDAIKALLQQIAALQAQLAQLLAAKFGGGMGTSTATTTPPHIPPGQIGKLACQTFGHDLKLGDKGEDVMKLQEILIADPSSGFTGTTTGFFGTITMKAVIKFQMKNGIKGSGFFGPMSRGFFERSCGKGLMKDHDNASSTKEKDDHKNASSTNDHWTATSSQKLPGGPGQSWTSDGHGDGHDGHNGHDD